MYNIHPLNVAGLQLGCLDVPSDRDRYEEQ